MFFVESWIYSSSLSIVQQYDAWFPVGADRGKPNSLFASKGELYETARRQVGIGVSFKCDHSHQIKSQLDIIGVQAGHLPLNPPFSVKVSSGNAVSKSSSDTSISNEDLLRVTNDREDFYKLYIDVTNRAISAYTKAGRRRSALKLHGSLAALELYIFNIPEYDLIADSSVRADIENDIAAPSLPIVPSLHIMHRIHGLD